MEQDLPHGKEIYLFFGKYGVYGILGIFVSSILMGLLIYKVFRILQEKKIGHYNSFINQIYPNEKTREIIKIMINLFLLISFYIMIAGFSAYFSQELGIPNSIATIGILIFCYVIFMGNIERVIKVNTVLIPVLIMFIIVLAIKNIDVYADINKMATSTSLGQSIYYAVLYGSYNTILLIPMMVSLKDYITNKKQAKLVAIACSILLILLAISIYGLLLKSDIDINFLELPTVYVAGKMGKTYQYLYGLTILVAIITSAISAGYGLLENYIDNNKKYKKRAIIMCGSAIIVSHFGFSNLINSLYPMFGLLGFAQIVLIIKIKLEKK